MILAAAIMAAACTSAPKGEIRTMKYFPDGRDIVCVNGTNRYTRPLYGTGTRFRLETSDVPVFATYNGPRDSYNFTFLLNGEPLDRASYCEARYRGGRRTYTVRDESWGGAELDITAMASFFEEGALWRFEARGFASEPTLKAIKRRVAEPAGDHNGDMRGTDFQREGFGPDLEDEGESVEWKAGRETFVFYNSGSFVQLGPEGRERYEKEAAMQQELASRVEINTPDPFFNTLGSVIMEAAGGIWDDDSSTWLHGACAWRSKLNGWRGAYVGDVVGWSDRSRIHFREYLKSMVTDEPQTIDHPVQDEEHLARSSMAWGTPIYSNGYICSSPGGVRKLSHYDMNLNFIDELLTHVGYDADPDFLREIWPYLVMHLEWEKRAFDPDGDHLYDAYAAIWASDALYYNSGAVTHSSAYNYRGNLLTARIAEIIGEDPAPFKAEAEAILNALNDVLWLKDKGYWAEYKDFMGHGRLHESAALWTIYTPIDCGACSPEQACRATRYVDQAIPHIPVLYRYDREALKALGLDLPREEKDLATVSESDWMPYAYSTNNVIHSEVAHMALAYLQAGRNDSGFKLLKSNLIDGMYLGPCPGNFGMGSYYDAAVRYWWRDFGDVVGISARAYVNGLFGIIPDALNGRCIIQPCFPDGWKEASIRTPYLSYSYHRESDRDIYEVEQNFASPLDIVVRAGAGGGAFLEIKGGSERTQTITVLHKDMPVRNVFPEIPDPRPEMSSKKYMTAMGLSDVKSGTEKECVDISRYFNAEVDGIFEQEYLSPRSPYCTLELPKHGFGDWCSQDEHPVIEDDGFRACIRDGVFDTGLGLQFLSPSEGSNIVYTSLWDNFPAKVDIPLEGRARAACLLMAGSTFNMQSRIENGIVRVTYTDGSESVMPLVNPVNWCPIEQDYHVDDFAFRTTPLKPYRVLLESGKVVRMPSYQSDFIPVETDKLDGTVGIRQPRLIRGGAAQLLRMPLDKKKELRSLSLETLSNDVVIGLMAVTLEK